MIKDKETAYQLRLAKIGNDGAKGVEICDAEAAYCKAVGLETGIRIRKAGEEAARAGLFFRIIRDAGRVGFFDRLDQSVFFMFPPGNDKEQEIEYAAVICSDNAAHAAKAMQKAIDIGRKTRKDAIIAMCGKKSCRFFKLREFAFEPVSR
ncbi:MAG: hypothetical protein WC506_02370 [Candidatus Micrarchaeia archaeon]